MNNIYHARNMTHLAHCGILSHFCSLDSFLQISKEVHAYITNRDFAHVATWTL